MFKEKSCKQASSKKLEIGFFFESYFFPFFFFSFPLFRLFEIAKLLDDLIVIEPPAAAAVVYLRKPHASSAIHLSTGGKGKLGSRSFLKLARLASNRRAAAVVRP